MSIFAMSIFEDFAQRRGSARLNPLMIEVSSDLGGTPLEVFVDLDAEDLDSSPLKRGTTWPITVLDHQGEATVTRIRKIRGLPIKRVTFTIDRSSLRSIHPTRYPANTSAEGTPAQD